MVHTCTGASGAPNTPSSNLRSDFLHEEEDDEEEETEGALASGPFIHWPHLPSPRVESWPSVPSGPSFSGESASAGLRLPDLAMKSSGGGAWCFRRRRSSDDIGDELLAGLLARERAGDRPRTTSSFSAEKNPCFRSIFTTLPHAS